MSDERGNSGSGFQSGRPQDASQGPVRPAAETRDRDLRRLQGLQMLMERAAGSSLQDLSAKYQISPDNAETIMSEAWQEGVVTQLQQAMIQILAPLAMATYEAQLKMGNLDAARDILGTMGVVQKPSSRAAAAKAVQSFAASQMAAQPREIPIDSIESYRLAKQSRAYRPGSGRRIDTSGEDT